MSDTKIRLLNLWNDAVFYLTIAWFVTKGYLTWFFYMGGVEIEVGYEEDGKEINYLYLEKLW